jgi:hypothetical protein
MVLRSTLAVTGLGLGLALALAVPAQAAPQSWTAPVTVSTTADAESPRVVTAPDGSITSVWVETGAGVSTIVGATSVDDGATWSTPQAISNSSINVRLPELAIDSLGVRTVVWVDQWGGSTVIEASSSADGLSWSAGFVLSGLVGNSTAPRLSIDSNDVRYVVWQALPNAHTEVRAVSSTDGFTWNSEARVSDPLTDSTAPDVGVLPNGNVIAIWAAGTVVQSSSSSDLGVTWGPIADLTSLGLPVGQPHLATSAAGLVAAIWYSTDSAGDQIAQTATSIDGQTWTGALDISAPGGSAELFDIAFAPDGTLHAIWDRYDSSGNSIVQAVHSTDGGATWSVPLDLSAAGENGIDARLVIDSTSAVTAAWTQDDLTTFPIIQYTTSTDGGSTFTLASALSVGGQGAATPWLALSASDVVTAVWTMFDGTNAFVQSAHGVGSAAAAAAASAPALAATGSPRYGTELAILGAALISAGVIAFMLRPRERGAHRA